MSLRNKFIRYFDTYVQFLEVLETADGTYFLDVCGYDGGDINDEGVEDYVNDCVRRFDEPEEIDSLIKQWAEYFEEEIPKVSFKDFVNS